MGKEILKVGNIEIEKNKFYRNKVLVHRKPLHIKLSETRGYVKSYDGQTKWMYFLIGYDDLLEKYNTIWVKVSTDIKKEFDSEPVYNKEFLKTKIKPHGEEVTGFYGKGIQKMDSNHTCLAVISLDLALKKNDS